MTFDICNKKSVIALQGRTPMTYVMLLCYMLAMFLRPVLAVLAVLREKEPYDREWNAARDKVTYVCPASASMKQISNISDLNP